MRDLEASAIRLNQLMPIALVVAVLAVLSQLILNKVCCGSLLLSEGGFFLKKGKAPIIILGESRVSLCVTAAHMNLLCCTPVLGVTLAARRQAITGRPIHDISASAGQNT
jgi:hypothetical protein